MIDVHQVLVQPEVLQGSSKLILMFLIEITTNIINSTDSP